MFFAVNQAFLESLDRSGIALALTLTLEIATHWGKFFK